MKRSKLLALLLVLVMLVVALVSCKGNDTKPKYKKSLLEGWDQYSLVYSSTAGSSVTDKFMNLTMQLKEKYGTMLSPSSDFLMPGEEAPTDTFEILIGNTNRQESQDVFATLKSNDYFIGVVNNRLLIIGGSDRATAEALVHFTDYLLADDGIYYPEEGYTYKYDYKVDTLTIDGVDISEFVIVRGNGMNNDDRLMVNYLQDVISNVCGVNVPIVIPSTEEIEHEILIGDTGREATSVELDKDTYAMSTEGGKLVMYGNGEYSSSFTIKKLIEDVLSNIKKGKSYDIKLDAIFGEPFSPPTLVSSNLPSGYQDLTDMYDYDLKSVDSVLDRFFITRDELPEEVTVLERVTPDQYPTSKERVQVYVSANNGSDDNDGSKNAPYKTIHQALSKVNGAKGGIIWVEGGNYSAADPITISNAHSGTMVSPLFIIGYGDTPVTVSGGKEIAGADFVPVDPEYDAVAARLKEEVLDKVVCINLYDLGWQPEYIIPVTPTSKGLLTVDGEGYTLARFPNAYYEDGSVLDSIDLLYIKHVYDTGSVADVGSGNYYKWKERVEKPGSGLSLSSVIGFEIQIVDERNPQVDPGDDYMRDEIINWVNTGEILLTGTVYSGWDHGSYTIDNYCVHDGNKLGTLKPDGFYSLKSKQPCQYGAGVSTNSAAKRNTYYLSNAIEALDAPGEWFIDRISGNLYLYPTSDSFAEQTVTYYGKSTGSAAIKVDGAEYVVIDGLDVEGSSARGYHVANSRNVVIQNADISNTKGEGVLLTATYDSAVLYCDFSNINGTMLQNAYYYYDRQMKPSNVFIQNNYFHDPVPQSQYGIVLRDGYRTVVSHNELDNVCMSISGFEHIIEYNEFRGGSKDVTDGGMIYTTSSGKGGSHVRYNLFHMFNVSQRAVYNDGKSNGNYAYGNIVNTRGALLGSGLQPWYSSSGHGNVCYENIMIIRDKEEYALAAGRDPETFTGVTDCILESDLFFYYYGPNNGNNSQAAAWLHTGENRGQQDIDAYRKNHDETFMKTRYPDHMNYLYTVEFILAAYDTKEYNPTYAPTQLTTKKFTYMVDDGLKIYVPPFQYLDNSGRVKTMPEKIIEARNGSGWTLTFDEISAVERLWRQGAMTVIAKNLIIGGDDDLSMVIRNNTADNAGYYDGSSYIEDNYTQASVEDIMPNLADYDYTISEEGWEYLESVMGPSFTLPLQDIDYTRMGCLE